MPNEIKSTFVLQFGLTQSEAFRVNVENGWWAERSMIRSICQREGIDFRPHLAIELTGLHQTELSEAIEAARKHDPETWKDHTRPHTMVREFAGAVIRIMDTCEYFGLPLAQAIEAEIEANRTRGYMHGGKAA